MQTSVLILVHWESRNSARWTCVVLMRVYFLFLPADDITERPVLGLFSKHFKGRKELEESTAESVYEAVDSFPSYFQIKELPTEYVLTT
jgi:F0F1-type ATP synthase beta subunit